MLDKDIPAGTVIVFFHDRKPIVGLVVDPEAGRRWADRDPAILEYPQSAAGKEGYVIVRILGRAMAEVETGGLPPEEPSRLVTLRWASVLPEKVTKVAGPDKASILGFLGTIWIMKNFSMSDATALNRDFGILIRHLTDDFPVEQEEDDYDRRYRTMLQEILPLYPHYRKSHEAMMEFLQRNFPPG